jgi:hypothetical protein
MDKICPHGLMIFVTPDGGEFNGCSLCNPPDTSKKRNKNIGYNDILSGKYCDADTTMWLAENGTIIVECPDHAQENFKEDYFSIKHRDPEMGTPFCYNKKAGWGNYMSIQFQLNGEDLRFNSSLNIRKAGDDDTTKKISCNDFIWQLFNIGFDLGRNHDIDEILTHLCEV